MMKNVKRLLIASIVLIFVISICISSYSADTIYAEDGFYYARTSSTTADLYGRSTTDADLVIPKDFSEYYVTNIVDSAFEEDQNIETVTFGDALLLERIGFYAFKNCINLSGQVNFGGRLNTIGASAFEDCHSLETVVFNAYVKDIPAQCFYNCTSLSTVVMNNRIQTIGKFAFANCTSLKEITIPDSITSIDATTFNGCEDLVIYCNSESYAHQYAEENQITHVLLDVNDGYYIGDVDGNGKIEILDATFIQRGLASLEYPDYCDLARGDVDGNEQTNIVDSTIIQRYLVNLGTSDYPIGEWVDQFERHEF